MSKQNFDKFINKEVKGAKKKEQIKQEKKLVKKEREAYFIEKKREQRAIKKLQDEQQKKDQGNKKKNAAGEPIGSIKPSVKKAKNRGETTKTISRNTAPGEKTAYTPPGGVKTKPADRFPTKKERGSEPRIERPFKKTPGPGNATGMPANNPGKSDGRKPVTLNKTAAQVQVNEPTEKKVTPTFGPGTQDSKPRAEKIKQAFKIAKPVEKTGTKAAQEKTAYHPADAKPQAKFPMSNPGKNEVATGENQMPLNKYIAHCGVCSRRDAGEIVKSGRVTVNGEKITDPGTKVSADHHITIDGKKIHLKQTLVYILLNKPKDYITTAEDPQGRKTVLDIVKNATPERIFPVGRLDRNTSGVLLLTNDGDLAQQLTHPSFEVRKIYEAKLDKPLTKADFTKLADGITLEDGFVQPDSLAYADSKDKSVIGIEIHSGRNRVVRRMFEHLGYDVRALDRVMFANLTKKNVDRGKWRFLNDKEIRLLKFFKSAKR